MLTTTLSIDERITTAHRAKLAYVYVHSHHRDKCANSASTTAEVVEGTVVPTSLLANFDCELSGLLSLAGQSAQWTSGHRVGHLGSSAVP